MNQPTLQELDDYNIASKFLIEIAISTRNPEMLRAIKTLMDALEEK